MTKKDKKDGPVEAQRRLDRAQQALQVAQDRRTAAILRGEQELLQARARADRWLLEATKRVERASVRVDRASAAVKALESRPTAPPYPAEVPDGPGDHSRLSESPSELLTELPPALDAAADSNGA